MTTDTRASIAWARLGRVIAAVKRPGEENSEFDQALDVLRILSRKEGIPIAIIGGMGAINYGYERLTDDIDVVLAKQHLDSIIRVAPQYGIKVIWRDPHGWHKLSFAGLRIEVIPEGGKPSKTAHTTIPSPKQLGVSQGLEYAQLEGWIETKIISGRSQDRADVIQVLKKTDPEAIPTIREHLARVHSNYVRLFDELHAAAEEEKEQERECGGPR